MPIDLGWFVLNKLFFLKSKKKIQSIKAKNWTPIYFLFNIYTFYLRINKLKIKEDDKYDLTIV